MGEGEGLQWNDQHSALVHADGTARRPSGPIAEGAGPDKGSEGRPRRARRLRGGRTEQLVLPTHSVEEVGEVLAAQMAAHIGREDQMFKLHFVDGEGDSVLVSTHTEIDDLRHCASITARLEPAVER